MTSEHRDLLKETDYQAEMRGGASGLGEGQGCGQPSPAQPQWASGNLEMFF